MQMLEGDPHSSTQPGFRGTRDPERSVTPSRSRRKKKWVEFEDVQPQDIPNPTEDNFPRRCITQLPDGVSHIYYTGKELTYWFYEYCGVGHPIVKEEVTGEVRISLDPPFSMSPHIIPAALHEMRQAGGRPHVDRFPEDGESRSVRTECTQGWYYTRSDAQRIQEIEEELVIARRQIDSIDHQLYAHDLQLRRGRDVRVVPLPPGGGGRTRQRGSGPRTRGGSTSRRGWGTGDDSE
ncbi:hypothetical protein GIB67_028967 [Kingdonia uniflora]|uniref:Uncharacterized protein n=1 Tax=Kingdonia uniflora TaxID=39325 RepID=A0A7J7LBV5_9MAGN|nr:hypothetical protein GIB67_028967 [Kingdonia uniflora]